MKKLCLLFSLLLVLTACGTRQTQTAEEAAQTALEAYGEELYFRADEDFITTNFGNASYLQSAVIYLSRAGDGSEFGFFELTDAKYREKMLTAVRDYLASEEQSVRSLAALYPADDLQARLRRFERATVGAEDRLVYYALTDN